MPDSQKNTPEKDIRPELWVVCFLVLSGLAIYSQTGHHDFIDYDDIIYVTQNPHVREGLTLEGVTWAFTTFHAANWHPLTWVSHMLDVQLYGMNPGQHHLTNVLLHIANTLLLFFLFNGMTRSPLKSGLVAALFAVHPLHVESVAWVAERKDLLSTMMAFLTMLCYMRYVARPGTHSYILTLCCFVLGLMAKPMLVTLPFVLLLLDYWPLCRIRLKKNGDKNNLPQRAPLHLVLEKLPFFVFSAASSVVTYIAQQSGGAVASVQFFPLDVRIGNALVSYCRYLIKTVYPSKLALLYIHPGHISLWEAAGAGLLLTAVTLAAVKTSRRYPYFIVGWLWYMGTLVPVIGIVQVGIQAMADRYTYIPLVGLFAAGSWGVFEFAAGNRVRQRVAGVACGMALIAFSMISWYQVRFWTDSISVFSRTVSVTSGNYVAHNNLGFALSKAGRMAEGIRHYREALRLKPEYGHAHNNLANALVRLGKSDQAIGHYMEALRAGLTPAGTRKNLGLALLRTGKIDDAIPHLAASVKLNPAGGIARDSLAMAEAFQGRFATVANRFLDALHWDMESPDPAAWPDKLSVPKAEWAVLIDQYAEALSGQPWFDRNELSVSNLPRMRPTMQAYEQSLERFEKKSTDHPISAAALYHAACVRLRRNETKSALEHLESAAERGFGDPGLFKSDWDLDPLRGSAAYGRLLKRVERNAQSASGTGGQPPQQSGPAG